MNIDADSFLTFSELRTAPCNGRMRRSALNFEYLKTSRTHGNNSAHLIQSSHSAFEGPSYVPCGSDSSLNTMRYKQDLICPPHQSAQEQSAKVTHLCYSLLFHGKGG
jgi:hypothetical protein